jgi:DNA ligase-associated metallophosphoesterase
MGTRLVVAHVASLTVDYNRLAVEVCLRVVVRAMTRRRLVTVPLPLLAPSHDNAACRRDHVLVVNAGGETVELHAERALHWPRGRMLFVADVHLGKGATFRAAGVPLPRGATANDLRRLTALIERTRATTLCVLGDFLHAAAGRVEALDRAVTTWRASHPDLDLVLVRGNHDRHAGDPPAAWRVRVVPEPHALPPFIGCHAPHEPPSGYALCGHVHPGVRVAGPARDAARLPCFVLGRRRALLPAFGRLTGLALVAPEGDETIVAIAGDTLFRLPAA